MECCSPLLGGDGPMADVLKVLLSAMVALGLYAVYRRKNRQAKGVDDTSVKLAQDALRRSEERYRVLFQSAEEGIFLMDKDVLLNAIRRSRNFSGCKWRK